MKTIFIFGFLIVLMACGGTRSPQTQSPANAGGRVIPQEGTLTLASVFDPQLPSPWIGGLPVSFDNVSQILPPLYSGDGKPVQATSMKMMPSNKLVVTYNRAGNEVVGGFDIIDFSNPLSPLVLTSQMGAEEEYADVTVAGNLAYFVGNDTEGAILRVVDLSNPAFPVFGQKIVLQGNTATSVAVQGARMGVTTAENGGYVRLDLGNPADPALIEWRSGTRAGHVISFLSDLIVFGEFPSQGLFRDEATGFQDLVGFPATLADAPARIAHNGEYAVTNGLVNGVSVLSFQPYPSSLTEIESFSIQGTGNGVAMGKSVSLLAQGDAGLIWVDHRPVFVPFPSFPPAPLGASNPNPPTPWTSIQRGAFDVPNDPGSANNVIIHEQNGGVYVMIADGRGGLRWIKETSRTEMRASRGYGPSVFYSDVHYVLLERSVTIPAQLQVTQGNAGNHWARLELDEVVCFYKGGSSQSNPSPSNVPQWGLGLRYNFHSCSNGKNSGQTQSVGHKIQLTLLNGASGGGTTTAQFSL